jgi:hypothetical protein
MEMHNTIMNYGMAMLDSLDAFPDVGPFICNRSSANGTTVVQALWVVSLPNFLDRMGQADR